MPLTIAAVAPGDGVADGVTLADGVAVAEGVCEPAAALGLGELNAPAIAAPPTPTATTSTAMIALTDSCLARLTR